jgi:peptidoglycan hydrolase-like protein with peptidoglycan-binding domain
MSWRVAESLLQARDQFNKQFPRRSKAADGTIGDAAHASRSSDHNPWVMDGKTGIVRALDITHDPLDGVDTYRIADNMRLIADPRVDYIISNGRIWNPTISKDWRKYNGKNPHDHHFHISVDTTKKLYDDRKPWNFGDLTKPMQLVGDRPIAKVPERPVLRVGMGTRAKPNPDVKILQGLLKITTDGIFGPGTEKSVKAFQTARSLAADGVVGFYTWKALYAAETVGNAAMPPASNFDRIMEFVFDDEGGWTQNPDEPGGASNMGVSRQTYSQYLGRNVSLDELRVLDKSQAKQFYREMFWEKIGAHKLNAGVGYAAFDFAVNSGTSIVDQVGADDFLTQALKKGDTPEQEIDILCNIRLDYMSKSPKWPKYKNGWSARVSRVRSRARALAA